MTNMTTADKPEPNDLRIRIVEALEDPRFKARTIEGIVKQVGASKLDIVEAISSDKDLASKVKIYPRRSKGNKLLITTLEKFQQDAPVLDKFIDLFGSKPGGTLHDIF